MEAKYVFANLTEKLRSKNLRIQKTNTINAIQEPNIEWIIVLCIHPFVSIYKASLVQ